MLFQNIGIGQSHLPIIPSCVIKHNMHAHMWTLPISILTDKSKIEREWREEQEITRGKDKRRGKTEREKVRKEREKRRREE